MRVINEDGIILGQYRSYTRADAVARSLSAKSKCTITVEDNRGIVASIYKPKGK